MKRITAQPFVFFLPFLAIYLLIILVSHSNSLQGDEGRYVQYARNLLNGYYSPLGEVYLWNGPGYPLVLMPILAMGLPLMVAYLLNALFQYISVVFIYKTLLFFVNKRLALIFSLFWACFYIGFKEMIWLYTEPISNMVMCIFLWNTAFVLNQKEINWKGLCLSGFLLGFLILIKVIFGYVLLVLLMLILIVFFIRRLAEMKKTLLILLIALMVNLPYLFYTWQLTGRVFYWANSGGMTLYWASTPVEAEFGDWNDDHFTAYCGIEEGVPCNAALFAKNHQADYDTIYRYSGVLRDDAFKRIAIENIKHHPLKYLKNCIANTGRLFFGMPHSYNYHRFQNLLRIPPGAIIMLMLFFSIFMTMMNTKRLPFVLYFFIAILFLYLGASIVVSTYQRMLTLAVPVIIIWTAYIAERSIRFNSKLS